MRAVTAAIAATGWVAATITGATAARLASELRPLRRWHAETPDVPARPRYPDARSWGEHLADEGALLSEHGFEDQAPYLMAAAGELLEATDHAGLR